MGRVVRWLRCRMFFSLVNLRLSTEITIVVQGKRIWSQRFVVPEIAQKCDIGAKIRTSKDVAKVLLRKVLILEGFFMYVYSFRRLLYNLMM